MVGIVTAAITAFQFDAPVIIQLVAKTGEPGPVVLLAESPVVGRRAGGVGLHIFGPMPAKIDGAVPTDLRRSAGSGEDRGHRKLFVGGFERRDRVATIDACWRAGCEVIRHNKK